MLFGPVSSDMIEALAGVLEVFEDGENAAVSFGVGREIELGEDAVDVLADGAFGDDQPLGDAGVSVSLCHQRKNLAFAWAERGE